MNPRPEERKKRETHESTSCETNIERKNKANGTVNATNSNTSPSRRETDGREYRLGNAVSV
jgi:hypothetical protein